MESRDLPSSSPSSTANRDASSATDAEDGVFTVAVALAKDAALHFQSGKFAECVEVLNQLLQKKQGDPKVVKFASPFSVDTDLSDVVSVLYLFLHAYSSRLTLVLAFFFLAASLRANFYTNCYASRD